MIEHKTIGISDYFKCYSAYLKMFLIILSASVPLAILYSLYPASFDKTFNGRAYYLFFVWLIILEYALEWEYYKSGKPEMKAKRVFAFGISLLLPTVYVVASNFLGLNKVITGIFESYGVIPPWLDNVPLAIEYLTIAVLFAVVIFFAYKIKGLMDFALSIALLGVIGAIHLINILYPYGGFTPFQIIVPATARISANVLNLMGYLTYMPPTQDLTPVLLVRDPISGVQWSAQIAWPCAGVESLLLYTIIMLLFLKKADIPRRHKIIYFTIGAAVTYFINILRIATLFVIGLNGGDVWTFHDYYGQLYSVVWIISYPLIIIGSRIVWSKYRDAIVSFIIND
ncbi:MAG: archaeosortase/exosortase family protein [Candidatus Bathyarchaeia archaeon]